MFLARTALPVPRPAHPPSTEAVLSSVSSVVNFSDDEDVCWWSVCVGGAVDAAVRGSLVTYRHSFSLRSWYFFTSRMMCQESSGSSVLAQQSIISQSVVEEKENRGRGGEENRDGDREEKGRQEKEKEWSHSLVIFIYHLPWLWTHGIRIHIDTPT